MNFKNSTSLENFDCSPHFFERVLSLLALVVLSPLFLAVALIVKLSSPGPVLYKQIRVGHFGRLFEIYKFRSMVSDAESSTGAVLSWKGDPRVTFVGNILRKTHIDELPQLINVILGDMVINGPRPERPVFVDEYDIKIPAYKLRHYVKPGITGLAQVSAAYDAHPSEKLQYDLQFIQARKSLQTNISIFVLTAAKILHVHGLMSAGSLVRQTADLGNLSIEKEFV